MVPVEGLLEEWASRLGHRSFVVAMVEALLAAGLTECSLQVVLAVWTMVASTAGCLVLCTGPTVVRTAYLWSAPTAGRMLAQMSCSKPMEAGIVGYPAQVEGG